MIMNLSRLLWAYVIGVIGGGVFYLIKLPLPWVLGPLVALLIWKISTKKNTAVSYTLRNISFVILGIQLGNTFTTSTFTLIAPYVIPYTLFSCTLITLALVNAYIITKWIDIRADTSMLGSIPGGLSASLALSDSMGSNTVLVTVFHTVRLLSVLFIIPFVSTHFFYEGSGGSTSISLGPNETGSAWTLMIYLAVYLLAKVFQHKVPAAFVMIPMIITGSFQAFGIAMYSLPTVLFIFAQVSLGVYLGYKISLHDVLKAGKYCLIYFGLSIILILTSFALGYIFSLVTGLQLATSILSIAPGGLIEMALTAQTVGGDPSIVSSLQMIRLLIIVIVVPLFLQRFLPKIVDIQNK
ncbi:AbrB family transcriptional regulator [Pontibacillus marinus]|uniref:AbrB family transcriptional regulator n=1 Tax=Pontibacillus marinus TaxID=273164 RepID=UPI0004848D1D|nr:AbrB family transcriptional regulator [Pontibacillus marinus]